MISQTVADGEKQIDYSKLLINKWKRKGTVRLFHSSIQVDRTYVK